MSPVSQPANDQAKPSERAHDHSMEEILASIRRIIADDQALPLTPRAAPPAPEPPPAPPVDEAAFDAWLQDAASGKAEPPAPQRPSLFRAARERNAAVEAAPVAAEPAPAAIEAAPVAQVAAPAPVAPAVAAHQDQATFEDHGRIPPEIVSEPAPHLAIVPDAAPELRGSAHDHDAPMAEHDDLHAPVAAGDDAPLLSATVGASVTTQFQALAQTMFLQNNALVEEAVRGMLRPMLKQWLDDNLPVIVERLVRAEIERVARGGR